MDAIYIPLIVIAVVLLACVLITLVAGFKRIDESQEKTNSSLSSMHNKDGKREGTILLPVIQMDPKSECNTVLPLPIGSEMCAHKMDVIVKEIIRAPHEERMVIICECTKCGVIDKTIAVTSTPPKPPLPPPLPPPPRSECRHKWTKEKSVTLSSAFEQMEELLKDQNKAKPKISNDPKKKTDECEVQDTKFDPSNAPAWMFKKKYVRERVCDLCGEVDRTVVSNFDNEEEVGETS